MHADDIIAHYVLFVRWMPKMDDFHNLELSVDW